MAEYQDIKGGVHITTSTTTIGNITVSDDSSDNEDVHAPVFTGKNVTIVDGDRTGGIRQSF
jgi:hypothetical protein